MNWVSSAADWATLGAALVVLAGLLSAWLSRPRVEVNVLNRTPISGTITVRHWKGAASARNVHWALVGLRKDNSSLRGDGMMPWITELSAGRSYRIELFDPKMGGYAPEIEVEPEEKRAPLGADEGVLVGLSWERSTAPWLRVYRTVVWLHADRVAGRAPQLLRGHKARKRFERAIKDGLTH